MIIRHHHNTTRRACQYIIRHQSCLTLRVSLGLQNRCWFTHRIVLNGGYPSSHRECLSTLWYQQRRWFNGEGKDSDNEVVIDATHVPSKSHSTVNMTHGQHNEGSSIEVRDRYDYPMRRDVSLVKGFGFDDRGKPTMNVPDGMRDEDVDDLDVLSRLKPPPKFGYVMVVALLFGGLSIVFVQDKSVFKGITLLRVANQHAFVDVLNVELYDEANVWCKRRTPVEYDEDSQSMQYTAFYTVPLAFGRNITLSVDVKRSFYAYEPSEDQTYTSNTVLQTITEFKAYKELHFMKKRVSIPIADWMCKWCVSELPSPSLVVPNLENMEDEEIYNGYLLEAFSELKANDVQSYASISPRILDAVSDAERAEVQPIDPREWSFAPVDDQSRNTLVFQEAAIKVPLLSRSLLGTQIRRMILHYWGNAKYDLEHNYGVGDVRDRADKCFSAIVSAQRETVIRRAEKAIPLLRKPAPPSLEVAATIIPKYATTATAAV